MHHMISFPRWMYISGIIYLWRGNTHIKHTHTVVTNSNRKLWVPIFFTRDKHHLYLRIKDDVLLEYFICYLCAFMCAGVNLCVLHPCICGWKSGVVRSSGVGVTGTCETPDMDAGNQSWVLCKSRKCFYARSKRNAFISWDISPVARFKCYMSLYDFMSYFSKNEYKELV